MSTDLIVSAVKDSAKALASSEVLLRASEALATIPEDLKITTDEEDAAWGDVAKAADRGAKHIESGMTEIFRPLKTFEKALREHFRTTMVAPLQAGIEKIDNASRAHRREKARKAEEARVAAEQAAEAARIAAENEVADRKRLEEAAAAEGLTLAPPEFDDAPGVAQVVVPPVEKIVRSEETITFERRTLCCVMEDEREARHGWAEAFVFDEKACLRLFRDMGNGGLTQDQLDAGVLFRGVRFKNTISIARRDR